MASWQDGPEYAPIERPDEFSVPEIAPLSVAEPYVQPAADAPVIRPAFGDPRAPVVPLAELVPAPDEPRDPLAPYAVVSSAMTTGDSAWTAVHWSAPTSPIATSASPWSTGPAIQTGPAPWSPPTAPIGPGPTGLPAPGTAEWFGPSTYAPPPAPVQVTAKEVVFALTPAMLIVLGLGGLIPPVAPITLVIAWALSTRSTVAKPQIRTTFVIAVATMAVLGLFIGFAGTLDFADWWDGLSWVAVIISWCVVVTVLVLATRALRSGQPPRTRPSTWA